MDARSILTLALLNAVASVTYRAVSCSRPLLDVMLDVMSPDETRAIAAPARAKPLLATLAATLGAAGVMFLALVTVACWQRLLPTPHSESAQDWPAGFTTRAELRKPNLTEAVRNPETHTTKGKHPCQDYFPYC
jgi:hypothetical protein